MAALLALVSSTFRALARVLGLVLIAVLAVAGLVVAILTIGGGSGSLSLAALAKGLGLPAFRDSVASLLTRLESSGLDAVPALLGLAAIVLGLLLLVGVFGGRRERTFSSGGEEDGRDVIRPRPLAAAAESLADQVDGVSAASAKARPSGSGGRVRIDAEHPRNASGEQLTPEIEAVLAPLRKAFGASTSVRTSVGESGKRVE